MRIAERDSVDIQKPQTGQPGQVANTGPGAKASRKPGASGEDRFDVGTQSELQALAMAAGEAERAERVERLRALVSSGRYTVEPVALSQAIVAAMLQGY
jgi:anti-sigma28 factor (negative regulator of flagellin synthesis)